MKKVLKAPAPRNKTGKTQSNGSVPAAIQRGIQLKAGLQPAGLIPPPQAPGPYYGQAHYGQARYAVTDPVVPPVSDGAKVKMGLDSRNNDNLQSFVNNHLTAMTDNPYFPTPAPAPADMLALYTAFQSALAYWVSVKTMLDDAATARDAARAALVEGMNVRGAYVQQASNGNTNVIISSGLEVRALPTPVGQLPPPTDLSAELNGTKGIVKLQWKPVKNARGYILECSPDVQPRAFSTLANTTKANAEKQLAPGETYVFRVAASGGSTGQSYWSPEVIRGVA